MIKKDSLFPSFYTVSPLSLRLTAWFLVSFGLGLIALCIAFELLIEEFVMAGPERAIVFELEEARKTFESDGEEALKEHIKEEADEFGPNQVFYRVFDTKKRVHFTSQLTGWQNIPPAPLTKIDEGATLFLGSSARPTRVVMRPINESFSIEGGIDAASEYHIIQRYRTSLPFIILVVLLLAGSSGYLAVFRTVRRIERLTQFTRDISGDDLTIRIPLERNQDELGHLAVTFNQMMERIESLVTSIKQVSEDIAHELRSPISKLRARAELLLSETSPSTLQIGLAENTIEECDGLLALINSMLEISEADANVLRLTLEEVSLNELVKTAIEFFEPIAELKNVSLLLREEGAVTIQGDLSKLQRAISNIIDNAVKYSKAGGAVTITLGCTNEGSAMVQIHDNGIGIAADEIPRLFERFYRVDSSRSAPGNGLGLTMSKALIHAHRGSIQIQSEVGEGTRVVIVLPAG